MIQVTGFFVAFSVLTYLQNPSLGCVSCTESEVGFTPTLSSVVEWNPGAFIFSLRSGWLAVNSLRLQLCTPNNQTPIWLNGVFMERFVTVVNPSHAGSVPIYKSFPDNSHVIAVDIILSFSVWHPSFKSFLKHL